MPGATWASNIAKPLETSSGFTLNFPKWSRIAYMALDICACLIRMTQTRPSSDSPLCSPKNTSLNFLRGFPRSPPADMVADKQLDLDYFYMFLSLGVSPAMPAQGDPPLLTEWWECSSASSCQFRKLVRLRDLTYLSPSPFYWAWSCTMFCFLFFLGHKLIKNAHDF